MPFSAEVLQHLAGHGLGSQVTRTLEHQKSCRHYNHSDHICFPWLVIEHKGWTGKSSAWEDAHCQLANATSAAVHMLRTLHGFKNMGLSSSRVPPVVGISTVADCIRVWITYYEGDKIVS